MTSYSDLETVGGAPVELYRFVVGSSVYAYTSSDAPVTFGSDTYAPTVIKRDEVQGTAESSKMQLEVGLAVNTDIAALFVRGAAPSTVRLTIYRYQRGNPTDTIILFSGQVSSCARQGGEATITCTPVQREVTRNLPIFLYQLTCNHTLYDAGCGVVESSFQTSGTISAVSADGMTLTITAAATKADGYFNGGVLTIGPQRAFIELHVGNQITLMNRNDAVVNGASVLLSAGCDRRYVTCSGKFSNVPRFLGFQAMPYNNPYETGVVT